jgi:hypothetical protein
VSYALATKRKEKNKVHHCVFVSLPIIPEKVKKWYYNQVAIDRTLLRLLLLLFFFIET